MLKVLGICGSPRPNGNTEILLDAALGEFDGTLFKTEKLQLYRCEMKPCSSCGSCLGNGKCCIEDDVSSVILPKLIGSDVIVIASPVYFNNVSAQVKILMDRTWCIRGKLRDKIGGGIVVGRGYGLESALTAIHAFMLKHEMILGHRGVSGTAYEKGDIARDDKATGDAKRFAKRLSALCGLLNRQSVEASVLGTDDLRGSG